MIPLQEYKDFKNDVLNIETDRGKTHNILLMGEIGVGKSSFANSVVTVLDPKQDDKIQQPAAVRKPDGESTTLKVLVAYICAVIYLFM